MTMLFESGSRKKILFLAPRTPWPPDKGDKIRTCHQLRFLAQRHDVYAAFFVDDPADMRHVDSIREICREVIAIPWTRRSAAMRAGRALLTGKPLTLAAYRDDAMTAAIGDWTARHSFDVVTAFSSSMAPYALSVPADRRVLDLCDVDSAKWGAYSRRRSLSSIPYAIESRRLAAFEQACVKQFDAVLVITESESLVLDPHGEYENLHVVSNGVNLPTGSPRRAESCGSIVGFVGAMDYAPNVDGVVWFANHVWPRVRAANRRASFLVIGRNPARRVERLARDGSITITGQVRDPRQLLEQCRVVVTPLRIARGLPNKALEAMAMGRPVVATTAVARCLDAQHGVHLLAADEPAEMADQVSELCESDKRCAELADAGKRFVSAYHNWTEILHRYVDLILGRNRLSLAGSHQQSRFSHQAIAV